MKKDIHAPGRPIKVMTRAEATEVLTLYETNTTRQLAKKFKVSQATICKRLKKARGVMGVMIVNGD